jgi:hypothetical protein
MNLDIEKAKSKTKNKLINFLESFDIDSKIIIANVRKSRNNIVGYYSSNSQFRSKLRIVVDFKKIIEYEENNWLIDSALQIDMTVFHEYAHSMAEYISWIKSYHLHDKTNVACNEAMKIIDCSNLTWQHEFSNEELFAEAFAEWAVDDCNDRYCYPFWSDFMRCYSKILKITNNI